MAGRAAHFHNKAKHAQREFGTAEPKMAARDTGTAWIGPFVSSIQGHTERFGVDSILAVQLGPTPEERALRLRELCALGVLHMSAHRVYGKFVEYLWELAPAGVLA